MLHTSFLGKLDILTSIILIILGAIVAKILIQKFLAPVVKRAIKRSGLRKYPDPADERARERTLISLLNTLTSIVIWTVAVIFIIGQLGVNWAALLSGAGLIGIIVGFGAQNTLRDLFKGFFILIEDQYRIGDIVQLTGNDGPTGSVEELSIRMTKLRSLDGTLHIIANGDIGVISNFSHKYGVVEVDINLPFDTDIDKLKQIVNRVGIELAKKQKWSGATIEPVQFLRIDSFNDYSLTIKCLGKVKAMSQWDAAADFREDIKKALQASGINFAEPRLIITEQKTKKELK